MVLAAYWAATLVNFKGIKASGWISTIGVILGTLGPGLLVIVLGLVWLGTGEPTTIHFAPAAFLPNLTHAGTIVLALGVLLTSFVGMEMSASHAQEVNNPQRDYPRAILFSAIIILLLAILGTIALAVVIPPEEINPIDGFMQVVQKLQQTFHLHGIVRVLAVFVAFGLFG